MLKKFIIYSYVTVMKILIAPDSFKDCLPAIDVTRALCTGIKSVKNDINVILFPMADGGDGTTEILNFHISGRWQMLEVNDPLRRIIKSRYLLLNGRNSAVIELAKASGLELLPRHERNPLHTTTYGTGELIRHALDNDADEVILSIGGSATVDGGTGIAAALGFHFFYKDGREFVPTGGTLHNIDRIDSSGVHPKFHSVRWLIASDVQNVLNGPEGAAHVYGPQKGADEPAVAQLEAGLAHAGHCIARETGFQADKHPGTGAAGGAALFLMAYARAELRSGFDIIAELTAFHRVVDEASLVITGEGKLDAQTQYGKVVSSVAHHTSKNNVPLIVVCGTVSDNPAAIQKALNADQIYTIRERAQNENDSLTNAEAYLEQIGIEIARKYITGRDST